MPRKVVFSEQEIRVSTAVERGYNELVEEQKELDKKHEIINEKEKEVKNIKENIEKVSQSMHITIRAMEVFCNQLERIKNGLLDTEHTIEVKLTNDFNTNEVFFEFELVAKNMKGEKVYSEIMGLDNVDYGKFRRSWEKNIISVNEHDGKTRIVFKPDNMRVIPDGEKDKVLSYQYNYKFDQALHQLVPMILNDKLLERSCTPDEMNLISTVNSTLSQLRTVKEEIQKIKQYFGIKDKEESGLRGIFRNLVSNRNT